MRTKLVTALLGVTAAGCGWPFGTETSCADLANCGEATVPDGGGAGGASGDASTGGRSGASTGGSGGASGTGGKPTGGAGGSSDAGSDADAEVDATPPCDGTASPSVATCVIDEEYGVFVSPLTGSDTTGDGSRLHPYATLAQAMSSVTATKRRIYACANGGSYAETLQSVGSLDDISFFGGFSCTDWTYDTSRKVQLASPNTTAWTVNGLTKGLTIEDFAITAADATAPGSSSIAMVVIQSENVVLRRTTIKAGKGADGAAGTTGAKGDDGAVAGTDQVGKAASCAVGAPASQLGGVWNGPSACGSQGGNGGGASKNGNGSNGNPGTPDTDVTPPGVNNGGAGSAIGGDDALSGTNGSKGNDGIVGPAAPSTGSFMASGYAAADGSDGSDGHPGQGGGGGGASRGSATCVGASGGAGGMGGCGGTHGGAGLGGGASVALAVWDSGVSLESVVLTAAKGGNGGKGGNAGDSGIGKGGALGGDAAGSIGAAGGGGRGGNGGRGGSGSGGTGGPSYALVFKGTSPTRNVVTLTPGQGGAKGTGGFVGAAPGTNPAPDGTAGEAKPEHEVP